MSTELRGDETDRDFRDRSTITAHKYPTKSRLHAESEPGESYEETILRVLDELEQLRQLRDALEQTEPGA